MSAIDDLAITLHFLAIELEGKLDTKRREHWRREVLRLEGVANSLRHGYTPRQLTPQELFAAAANSAAMTFPELTGGDFDRRPPKLTFEEQQIEDAEIDALAEQERNERRNRKRREARAEAKRRID